MQKKLWFFSLMVVLVFATSAQAVTVLTFEGLGDHEAVLDYYNGGFGGSGSGPGPNYGITFGADSLALIDADAGGNGNFANEPSPNTIAFFLTGSVIMNVPAGFGTGFSFYYSSIDYDGSVTVYDGPNGTGSVLANLSLPALGTTPGGGDPNGDFNRWAPVGVAFAGTAFSVNFGGAANFIGFDNITLESDVPVPPVPVPGTLLLLGTGVIALIGSRRRS